MVLLDILITTETWHINTTCWFLCSPAKRQTKRTNQSCLKQNLLGGGNTVGQTENNHRLCLFVQTCSAIEWPLCVREDKQKCAPPLICTLLWNSLFPYFYRKNPDMQQAPWSSPCQDKSAGFTGCVCCWFWRTVSMWQRIYCGGKRHHLLLTCRVVGTPNLQ